MVGYESKERHLDQESPEINIKSANWFLYTCQSNSHDKFGLDKSSDSQERFFSRLCLMKTDRYLGGPFNPFPNTQF